MTSDELRTVLYELDGLLMRLEDGGFEYDATKLKSVIAVLDRELETKLAYEENCG